MRIMHVVLAGGLCGVWAGCAGTPRPPQQIAREDRVQANWDRRVDRLHDDFAYIDQSESQRVYGLEKTAKLYADGEAARGPRTEQNFITLDAAIQQEFARFQERQPTYQAAGERVLLGDLDHAGDTGALLVP